MLKNVVGNDRIDEQSEADQNQGDGGCKLMFFQK
jgi:hypothetical protein